MRWPLATGAFCGVIRPLGGGSGTNSSPAGTDTRSRAGASSDLGCLIEPEEPSGSIEMSNLAVVWAIAAVVASSLALSEAERAGASSTQITAAVQDPWRPSANSGRDADRKGANLVLEHTAGRVHQRARRPVGEFCGQCTPYIDITSPRKADWLAGRL